MVYYLCAHIHGHKFMDWWQLFRINKSWITVVKRQSRENFLDYTISDANFQIPWNLILWSPHNGCLEFGDPPHKRALEFSDPPTDLSVPPPVVNGHSLTVIIKSRRRTTENAWIVLDSSTMVQFATGGLWKLKDIMQTVQPKNFCWKLIFLKCF